MTSGVWKERCQVQQHEMGKETGKWCLCLLTSARSGSFKQEEQYNLFQPHTCMHTRTCARTHTHKAHSWKWHQLILKLGLKPSFPYVFHRILSKDINRHLKPEAIFTMFPVMLMSAFGLESKSARVKIKTNLLYLMEQHGKWKNEWQGRLVK